MMLNGLLTSLSLWKNCVIFSDSLYLAVLAEIYSRIKVNDKSRQRIREIIKILSKKSMTNDGKKHKELICE